MHDALNDAIEYWEARRVSYNVLLLGIVVTVMSLPGPHQQLALTGHSARLLLLFAVLANAVYCAAYVIDIPVQLTGFGGIWRRWRWGLFATGATLAGIIAQSVTLDLLRV